MTTGSGNSYGGSDDGEEDRDASGKNSNTGVGGKSGGNDDEKDKEEEEVPAAGDADVDALAEAVERKVRLSSEEEEEVGEDEAEEAVDDIPECCRKAAKWIGSAKKILVVSGAGVSVSAGIPDFRTPGTGLYDNLSKYNLPYPEAVFDVNFYARNPMPFVSLASEIWPGRGRHHPTVTHSFVSLLAKRGKLLRNYSQNIDGLEHLADVPEDLLVECHGHFRSASCIRCGTPAPSIDDVREAIVDNGQVPACSACGGGANKMGRYVKPDIVFFGEGLPDRFHNNLRRDVADADLCVVLGTSLQVAPVSLIPEMTRCHRILINREHVGGIGVDPNGPKYRSVVASSRDIFVPGDCDDAVLRISRLLGWEKELRAMNEKVSSPPSGGGGGGKGGSS